MTSVAPSPEGHDPAARRYLATIRAQLTTSMSDDDLLVVGRAACEVSPRMTREGAVEYLADTTTRGNRETAEILVASAHNELCPAAVFSQVPATPALTTPSQASPLTTFGSGTYGVGVDVAPGKYRTPGADNCYWAG